MLFKLSEFFLFLVLGIVSLIECCFLSFKCNRKVSFLFLNGFLNYVVILFERSFILFRFDMFVYFCFFYFLLY